MIDLAMAAALGAVAAGLIALALLPLLWQRARRQVRRELAAAIPLSAAEMRAGLDAVRAEAAVDLARAGQVTRREQSRRAAVMADAGRLAIALREARGRLAEVEETSAEQAEALARLREAAAAALIRAEADRAELVAAQATAGGFEHRLADMRRGRETAEITTHEARVELATMRTRFGVMEDQLDDRAREIAALTAAGVQRDGEIALLRIEIGQRETALASAETRLAAVTARLQDAEAARRAGTVSNEDHGRMATENDQLRRDLKQLALDIARAAIDHDTRRLFGQSRAPAGTVGR